MRRVQRRAAAPTIGHNFLIFSNSFASERRNNASRLKASERKSITELTDGEETHATNHAELVGAAARLLNP